MPFTGVLSTIHANSTITSKNPIQKPRKPDQIGFAENAEEI
jgi:hypothetical protein